MSSADAVAFTEQFGTCAYIPKHTESYPYPEWEVLNNCASYKEGVLKIAKTHINNIGFTDTSTTSDSSLNNAPFFTAKQYFYVKSDGRFLPVIFYDNGADYYQEGLTRSLVNGKIAYFDKDFKQVITPKYDWGWPFESGKALVCKDCVLVALDDGDKAYEGGLWGYINKQGEEVVPVKYQVSDVPDYLPEQ